MPDNPFSGWRPEQQCRDVLACDFDGYEVPYYDHAAVQWCAAGWLLRHTRWSDPDVIRFRAWLSRFVPGSCDPRVTANDRWRWAPDDFRRAWDSWRAGATSYDPAQDAP